jgi:hypothetical protein
MAAGKRLDAVKNAVPEQSSWTILRRVEELGDEW